MIFNLILFFPLAHVGLALATSLSAILNASMLFMALRKAKVLTLDKRWLSWIGKLAIGNLLLILFIQFQMSDVITWQNWSTFERIESMLVLIFGSLVVYFMGMFIAGVRGKDLRHG